MAGQHDDRHVGKREPSPASARCARTGAVHPGHLPVEQHDIGTGPRGSTFPARSAHRPRRGYGTRTDRLKQRTDHLSRGVFVVDDRGILGRCGPVPRLPSVRSHGALSSGIHGHLSRRRLWDDADGCDRTTAGLRVALKVIAQDCIDQRSAISGQRPARDRRGHELAPGARAARRRRKQAELAERRHSTSSAVCAHSCSIR